MHWTQIYSTEIEVTFLDKKSGKQILETNHLKLEISAALLWDFKWFAFGKWMAFGLFSLRNASEAWQETSRSIHVIKSSCSASYVFMPVHINARMCAKWISITLFFNSTILLNRKLRQIHKYKISFSDICQVAILLQLQHNHNLIHNLVSWNICCI